MKCSGCAHMFEDEGFAGTEVTGSTPPEIHCGKGHWTFDFSDARGSLRMIAEKGEGCPDIEAVK